MAPRMIGSDHPRGACQACKKSIYWLPGLGLVDWEGSNWCAVDFSDGHRMYLPTLTDPEEVRSWLVR